MTGVLVLADDLTGAGDAGAQCALRGVRSLVTTQLDVRPGDTGDAHVLVVDTASRHDSPAGAARKVTAIAARFRDAGVRRFYKKTDSTLRGNVGAELAALAAALGAPGICFVPAYPEAGRCTRSGIHYVGGVPVAESAFGRDPRCPVRESSVARLLAQQSPLPVRSIPITAFEGPGQPIEGIVAVDASSAGDVSRIAAVVGRQERVPCAGPVGFFGRLLDQWDLPRDPLPRPSCPGPLLLVNGSLHERSLQQTAWACGHGFHGVRFASEELACGACAQRVAAEAARTLAAGQDSVIGSAAGNGHAGAASCESAAASIAATMREVDRRLGRSRLPALVIFGGDTAAAVVSALGITRLWPVAFLDDGVSVSATGAEGRVIVTKSGGFGPVDIAGRVRAYLAGTAP